MYEICAGVLRTAEYDALSMKMQVDRSSAQPALQKDVGLVDHLCIPTTIMVYPMFLLSSIPRVYSTLRGDHKCYVQLQQRLAINILS